jgi:hypothetical protein
MAKAKRSVTITGALITGTCTVVAALVGAAALYLFSPSRAVEQPLPTVSTDSGRDSNAVGAVDAKQPVASYDGSFEDYLGRLAALRDRNLEREEFLHSMIGKCVVWRGCLASVSDSGNDTFIVIRPSRQDSALPAAGVYFSSATWRTRLYALQNGDQVEVTATVRRTKPAETLLLDGLSLTRVEVE